MKRQKIILLPLLLAASLAGCNRADSPGGPVSQQNTPANAEAPQPAPQAAAPQPDPHSGLATPPATPAAQPAPAATQTPGKLVLPGGQSEVPKTWVPEAPETSMRAAQFRVPGATPDANAEVAVFHFGPGQGGTQEANIARWASQFSTADGKPVQPVVKKFKANGLDVTTVELQGSYARGVGMGPEGQGRPNQILLVGLVETPKGRITVQLHGPKATVDQNRAAFMSMLQNIQPS